MARFQQIVAALLVLLLFAGCGPRRAATPLGQAYPVAFSDTVTQRLTPARLAPGRNHSSGGGGWNCQLGGGSSNGGDLAAIIVIAVVVVIVVAVVVSVVGTEGEHEPSWRYALHMGSDDLPVEVIRITDDDRIYLTSEQYAALAHGAFTQVTIQPATWTRKEPRPSQPVRVSVDDRRIHIEVSDDAH